MKVKVDERVFLVHWQYREKTAQYGDKNRKLISTTCVIREVNTDNGECSEFSKATVNQNYKDSYNKIFARKLSFQSAIKDLDKRYRVQFWDEFKRTTKYENGDKKAVALSV